MNNAKIYKTKKFAIEIISIKNSIINFQKSIDIKLSKLHKNHFKMVNHYRYFNYLSIDTKKIMVKGVRQLKINLSK